MSGGDRPAFRCAVYTRKSSEEGLEQDFNSLHAQRGACEAYVRSQRGEGWSLLKAHYDDGGISGGTMERPGLLRLLADIAAGKIDVVVVYKVDRLTRSLMDFAKIVEIFDRHSVSFVSVTQSFNTTTSMGRLTLNVLLSFAQFEREVTGERIRDKVAASKKKGLWMGGNLPLGYDADGRTLKINEAEAERVRHIFRRYIELRSVHRLKDELEGDRIHSKSRTTRSGRQIGGGPMQRGALFHLLANPIYVGEIRHKSETYPGLHVPIVDKEAFAAVQAILAENRADGRNDDKPGRAVLAGKIFGADGAPMSPTAGHGKSGVRYRYYAMSALQRGGRCVDGGIRRLPAPQLEAFVADATARLCGISSVEALNPAGPLRRLDILEDAVVLSFQTEGLLRRGENLDELLFRLQAKATAAERVWLTAPGALGARLPIRLTFRGGRNWILPPADGGALKPRPDAVLIEGLRSAHRLCRAAGLSPLQAPSAATAAQVHPNTYRRKLSDLAFLAPDIQAAILAGRQPPGLTLQSLITQHLPISWAEQRRSLGFRPVTAQGNLASESESDEPASVR